MPFAAQWSVESMVGLTMITQRANDGTSIRKLPLEVDSYLNEVLGM